MEHGDIDGVEAATDVDLPPEGAVVGVVEVVSEVGSAVLHQRDPVGEGHVGVALGGEGLGEEAVLVGRVEVALEGLHLLARETLAFERVAALEEGVGHHPAVLQGAAGVAGPALAVVGGAGDGRHRLQVGWGVGGELVLVGAEVGLADDADVAIAPGLLGDPLDRVVAVGAFGQVGGVVALGAEAAAAVLGDERVAKTNPEVGARVGAATGATTVGRARQDRGEGAGAGRAVDIALQLHAVAHRSHDVFVHGHIDTEHLGHGCPPLYEAGAAYTRDGVGGVRYSRRGSFAALRPAM